MWSWQSLRQNHVLLENDDVIVLNKPPGLSVVGERHATDVVELAREAGEWLMPVHRIDKVTSGVVLLAKRIDAHGPLTREFAKRSVVKAYLAVVRGTGLPANWSVDLPLTVGRKSRVRVAGPRERLAFDETTATWALDAADVTQDKRIYPAVTHVHRLREKGGSTLVLANPVTGRRHQIRVHLAWTGSPILGDPLFTAGAPAAARTHLHSWKLSIGAPWERGPIEITADPDETFLAPVGMGEGLGRADGIWRELAGHRGLRAS